MTRHRRAAFGMFLALAILSVWAPLPAQAQPREHRLVLDAEYRSAGPVAFGIAGALALGAATAELFYRPEAPWAGRRGGETRLSNLLEDHPTTRRRMALAARLLGVAVTTQAQLVDPALVVWAGDRNGPVARELYAQNSLAFAVTAFVGAVLTPTIRRPRPSYDRCLFDPAYDPACGTPDVVRSLVDTRLALTFTAAALTCTHHHQLPVYGAGWADRTACIMAATTASLSGLFSYLADRQHVTDVLVAAALGVLAGFVLPTAVGYGF